MTAPAGPHGLYRTEAKAGSLSAVEGEVRLARPLPWWTIILLLAAAAGLAHAIVRTADVAASNSAAGGSAKHHILKAASAGRVSRVRVRAGGTVAAGDVLVEVEPLSARESDR
jgi:multidrug efflux pump subunit AcrA (membrane-fusion protein)